jgi:type I restriction enzyme S subunit
MGVLKISSVTYGTFRPGENKAILTHELERSRENPRRGCVLVSRANTRDLVGASVYVAHDHPALVLPDKLWQLYPDPATVDGRWLQLALSTSRMRARLSEAATGTSGSMKNISRDKFLAIELLFPPLPEQRKIAAIPSSVDDAIEASQAVIDQLQVVKKAVMAELLTKGLPGRHKRFKQTEIGQVPEEWDVVTLSAACEFLDGQRVPIKSSDREAMKGPYPYYGASGIIDWVNRFLFDETLLLLAEDGANITTRATPVAFRVEGKCWVNNHAHVLRARQGTDVDFLVEYLESLDYGQFSTGTAQPKLNQAVCQRIPVAFPPFEEQKQIGGLSRGLIGRLEAESAQLQSLRGVKSALMSVLLTGEVRVRVDEEAAA